ncbi:MAG: hypothetical protein ACFBSD_04000, partial [Paracoccaceae bacterium]
PQPETEPAPTPDAQPTPPAPEPAQTRTAAAPERQPIGRAPSQFSVIVTRGERNALRLGIKRFFSFSGRRDPEVRVTLGIQLSQAGRIVEGPVVVNERGGDAALRNALAQAGRRALIRAQHDGIFEQLPPQKYAGWRYIHVTFTPDDIGFSS